MEQSRTMGTIIDAMAEGLGVIDEDGRFRLQQPGRRAADSASTSRPDASHEPQRLRPVPAGRHAAGRRRPGLPADLRGPLREAGGPAGPQPGVPEGRIIQVSGAELPAGADGRRQAVVVFHDVTADRRHRDELASFAGVVAHDLLNPLTTIEGWSEALAADLDDGDEFAGSSVARIQRAGGPDAQPDQRPAGVHHGPRRDALAHRGATWTRWCATSPPPGSTRRRAPALRCPASTSATWAWSTPTRC